MKIKLFFLGAMLSLLMPSYAEPIFKINTSTVSINQCPIEKSNNVLDLAIVTRGFFVVNKLNDGSEQMYTRYGQFQMNQDGFVVTSENEYVMKITDKTDPDHLSKLQISTDMLPPKATSEAKIAVNLSADAPIGEIADFSMTIYDGVGIEHSLSVMFKKLAFAHWLVNVLVDDTDIGSGQLYFTADGQLEKQDGFHPMKWPVNGSVTNLDILFDGSTQYAGPFEPTRNPRQNGHTAGQIISLSVTADGEIILGYNNAEMVKVEGRIAIAHFTSPGNLEPVFGHSYRASEASGPALIDWSNSKYAILSGALEQESCLLK